MFPRANATFVDEQDGALIFTVAENRVNSSLIISLMT